MLKISSQFFVMQQRIAAIAFVGAIVLSGCDAIEDPNSFSERENTGGDLTGGQQADPNSIGGFTAGVWGTSNALMTEDGPASDSINQTLDIAENGTVLLSSSTESSVKVMRATFSENYQDWKTPSPGVYSPSSSDMPSTSTMAMFGADKASGDGYIVWGNGTNIKVSDYMTSMSSTPHSMGTANLDDGHAPQLLVSRSGSAHLVTQVHMNNGFGLNAFSRSGFATWSSAVQLHRMGMDTANAISMSHDDLSAFIDGNNNLRVIWIETQAANIRLMTAVFDTTAGSWSEASAILDSAGDTHGVDIASINSISASGEHGNANVHLAIMQVTASDESIITMDFIGTAWSHPMRRDNDMSGMASIVGPVVSAVFHEEHVMIWVDAHMGNNSIKSFRYSPTNGWGTAVKNVAVAESGASIDKLGLALNHEGHALATWIESDGSDVNIAGSLQIPGTDWQKKRTGSQLCGGHYVAYANRRVV